MSIIVNPYDGGGFGLAEMSTAISIIPNNYGRIGNLGMFQEEGITQRTVLLEEANGTLTLLPSVPVNSPATVGNDDNRTVRSFVVPHIPHNDAILPTDIQGVRGFGLADAPDPAETVMNRKLLKMRQRHDLTLEYMRAKALQGIVKDGRGNTLYNYFTEFGITQKTIDFVLGTSGTEVLEKIRELNGYIEDNLLGETMTGLHVLASPAWFAKFIKHPKVTEAYKYFQATNQAGNPNRDDLRSGFSFGGVTFEEYRGKATLFGSNTTDSFIADGDAVAFPLGTMDTFKTFLAPANLMDTVNTVGQRLYAYQLTRQDRTGIDLFTQSNPLPLVRRPALVVRLFSSN